WPGLLGSARASGWECLATPARWRRGYTPRGLRAAPSVTARPRRGRPAVPLRRLLCIGGFAVKGKRYCWAGWRKRSPKPVKMPAPLVTALTADHRTVDAQRISEKDGRALVHFGTIYQWHPTVPPGERQPMADAALTSVVQYL